MQNYFIIIYTCKDIPYNNSSMVLTVLDKVSIVLHMYICVYPQYTMKYFLLGLSGLPPLVAFTSDESHYSITKVICKKTDNPDLYEKKAFLFQK